MLGNREATISNDLALIRFHWDYPSDEFLDQAEIDEVVLAIETAFLMASREVFGVDLRVKMSPFGQPRHYCIELLFSLDFGAVDDDAFDKLMNVGAIWARGTKDWCEDNTKVFAFTALFWQVLLGKSLWEVIQGNNRPTNFASWSNKDSRHLHDLSVYHLSRQIMRVESKDSVLKVRNALKATGAARVEMIYRDNLAAVVVATPDARARKRINAIRRARRRQSKTSGS